jgi:hypothetical protein
MADSLPKSDASLRALSDEKRDEFVDTEKVEAVSQQIPTCSDAELRRIKRKIDIRVTGVLALMYIANQLDRGNISFA